MLTYIIILVLRYNLMAARKRKQGQQRRLKKYIFSQTGTTDTTALKTKEDELAHKVSALQDQIASQEEEIRGHLHHTGNGTDVDDIHDVKKKNLAFLIEMKEQFIETIRINKNIYESVH